MKQNPILVGLTELRKIVTELKLGDPQRNEYMEPRWLKYVKWWDSRASEAKGKYLAMRIAVVVAGTLGPGSGWCSRTEELGRLRLGLLGVSMVASLVVAIGTGLDSLFNFGDISREERAAAELIKSEGFSCIQHRRVPDLRVPHNACGCGHEG